MNSSADIEMKKEEATVLIVDDKTENLMVLGEILQPLNQNIVKVSSGEAALKYLLSHDATVVIMDVTMPGLSGFETAAMIREREKSRHIPIIFVTGVKQQEAHQGYSLGGVDYILKPIVPEILRAKVAVFVELFRKTAEISAQRRVLQQQNDELNFEIVERRRVEKDLWELNKTLELRVAEKTADAQLHAAELARSNAELEQFAHVVSHDLQEPIRKIVNFTRILEEMFPSTVDGKAKEYFAYIVDGAIRMRTLIQDLLQFSQVAQPQLNLEKVDVNAMISEILFELDHIVTETSARVMVETLPLVDANPTQLRQLFQNLIRNAMKFRRDVPPVIEISAIEERGLRVFSVKDNGIGIEEQHWGRIFNVFQRLHTRREYPGSGIGLSICKKIVERHGGGIWLRSVVGEGSTFYFSLPIKRQEKTNDNGLHDGPGQSEEKVSSLHR